MQTETQNETLADFILHTDATVVQLMYPLLRKGEAEYGLTREQVAGYVGNRLIDLIAVYLGVEVKR